MTTSVDSLNPSKNSCNLFFLLSRCCPRRAGANQGHFSSLDGKVEASARSALAFRRSNEKPLLSQERVSLVGQGPQGRPIVTVIGGSEPSRPSILKASFRGGSDDFDCPSKLMKFINSRESFKGYAHPPKM